MKKIIIYTLMAAALVSCDKFLDQMPDNRTELDSEAKITALLTSAYPETCFIMATELISDNVDDYRVSYTQTDRFADELFAWKDVTESDNESPENIWQSAYSAIAAANEALRAIDNLGCNTKTLREAKAEALLCRAYNHFILVNLFCWQYNSETSDSDMGIPYMEAPETLLRPSYSRETVASVYEKINRDIEEALPLQGDSYFSVPKYHFNRKAAYAFASRFNLYYEKWDKAEEYATICLGDTPEAMLRNYEALAELPSSSYSQIVNKFIDANEPANFLLLTAYSGVGLAFGPYAYYTAYSHGAYLAETEDILASQLWGQGSTRYVMEPKVYENALDRVIFWKLPYLFEYTDPVAQIGYYRTVYPAFWAEETLLNRAEARILQGKYDDAAKDINLWIHNTTVSTKTFTVSNIVSFYNGVNYAEWNKPTVKKHLNPYFAIGKEGETKEAMLQCVVGIRRIETMAQGMRWFDIKRYGIEIDRRIMNDNGNASLRSDHLAKDDLRRAMQLPLKVTDAGLAKNPR